MLSSCGSLICLLFLGLATLFAQETNGQPQPDGEFVPRESTFAQGNPPELQASDSADSSMKALRPAAILQRKPEGTPDEELNLQVTPKPRVQKERKATIVFPSPRQLSAFHSAPQPQADNQFVQQEAKAESSILNFPAANKKPLQFPNKSQLKPFHFGPYHKMRLQHQFGAQQPSALQQGDILQPFQPMMMMSSDNAFMGQDAPYPEASQSPMMDGFPQFLFAPRAQPQWGSQEAPLQFDDNQQGPMPQWAVQEGPQMQYVFPPVRSHRRRFGPPPMYYDSVPIEYNNIGDYDNRVEEIPPFEYDNFPPMGPPLAPWNTMRRGRWSRHRSLW